ncbi:glutamyl-tRNA reductase [Halanaerobium salsuginis]|uniref:Glutamyl-tRNA reductase n=1 Tax=Halanaerobium salsuginis TaxID=29563 RepID=A0A1I4JRQ7_9FIRM|nr:glutamyl-tRNA reductase [Halanaerobium salsuginis]SFL69001.1 glutamyl-tRNA reductase [Halanaerobium salsuginis]
MYLLTVGINHKTAPLDIRNSLSLQEKELRKKLLKKQQELKMNEFLILSTCNRFEIYIFSESDNYKQQFLKDYFYQFFYQNLREDLHYKLDSLSNYLYFKFDLQAVEHLYRVAAGLDSLVTGETQILAQLKRQFNDYQTHNLTDSYLNQLFLEAIRIGKLVRTETKISEKAVSVSYSAVELARNIFGDLQGEKVMILGAGETAELLLKNLVNYGVEGIIVANRTYSNGQKLADKYGGEVIHWQQLTDRIAEVDIIIASTAAPHTVLHKNDLKAAMQKKHGPMFLIDIALPRDIDCQVEELAGVHLYNIDDLQQVVDHNLDIRAGEISKAEAIIAQEKYKFRRWLRERSCVPLIKEMRADAEQIKADEVARALHLLATSELSAEEIIEQLGHRLLNKLLHQPTIGLKAIAAEEPVHKKEKLAVIKKIFAVGD